ncbi:hypothetical protein [Oricola sp.]|uniref:hypothetical protein n=1 Tax=Oricola sp. TaxID=1979950 RepID=UPI003BA84435
MKPVDRQTLFKPTRAESKQASTDIAAREMIDSEASKRREKTARLKEMRLAREAEQAGADTPPARTAKKVRRVNRRP